MPSLIQISDTHLDAEPGARRHGWCAQAALDAVLADIRARQRPDALIATGDLVHDESAAGYARLAEQLRGFGRPAYALPGNHDHPQRLAAALGAAGLGGSGRVRLDGWQLLLLDGHLPGADSGRLPEAALDQLDTWLGQHPEPALLCLHHPPVRVGSRWLDQSRLENGPELLRRLRRHAQLRAVLFGHIHQAFDLSLDGLRLLGTPATCRQFLPGADEFREDVAAAPGYRVLQLAADGSFDTQVCRVPAARRAGCQTLNE